MNIYEKLQSCKAELQTLKIPKTGKNKFAGYDYWELSDFLPTVVSLFAKHKLCSVVTFNSEIATIQLINIEAPEEVITVSSPMATAELKGCHAIQNMGAVETYQRRYLYMALLDISEPDALDATQGSDKSTDKHKKQEPKLDRAKATAEIKALAKELDKSKDIANILAKFKVSAVDELNDTYLLKTLNWLKGLSK